MKVLTLVTAAVLVAGCEVNLNTEGLTTRELKTFKVTGSFSASPPGSLRPGSSMLPHARRR